MTLNFRKYENGDWRHLVSIMSQFWDDLIRMDPTGRMIHPSNYGEVYCQEMLQRIKESNGQLIWAYSQDALVGLAVGVIEQQTKQQEVEYGPERIGRILEIYVLPEHRGRGFGEQLFRETERFLLADGCTLLKVEVFAHNHQAHGFYRKMGYSDWLIDLCKKV